MNPMRSSEQRGRNIAGRYLVIGPLRLLWVVAEKGDRRVVVVEDSHAPLEFRNHNVVAIEARLAGAAQVLRDRADKLAVKIDVAQAAVLAVADQHKWLVIARIH